MFWQVFVLKLEVAHGSAEFRKCHSAYRELLYSEWS
jgi:hypothetical protein